MRPATPHPARPCDAEQAGLTATDPSRTEPRARMDERDRRDDLPGCRQDAVPGGLDVLDLGCCLAVPGLAGHIAGRALSRPELDVLERRLEARIRNRVAERVHR